MIVAVRALPDAVVMASSTTSAARPCRLRFSITVSVKSASPEARKPIDRDADEEQGEQGQEPGQRDRRRQGSAADVAEAVVERQDAVEPGPPPSPPLEVEHGGTVPT